MLSSVEYIFFVSSLAIICLFVYVMCSYIIMQIEKWKKVRFIFMLEYKHSFLYTFCSK